MPYKDPEARRAYWRRRRREIEGRALVGSDEHRARISASITEHWKTRPRRDQSGPANPNWNDDASGNSIHTWLRKNIPKVGACSECGKEGKTDRAFLRHPDPYTRDPADYAELCRSCHVRYDRGSLELRGPGSARNQEASRPPSTGGAIVSA